ncbi:hypothetical protein HJFPF1_11013 [Paramyrothecium foliicola]|nr:hypothetical protein HJFPF1_11013 [Paramyrothecium foliicola]
MDVARATNSSSLPAYFELSWAILSTIGISNVFFGVTVAGITGFPPIVLAPIIVSAAGAIANGLCYYAFYAGYPILNSAVASSFADLTWLIQEAGLSFYSYVILTQVLDRRDRKIFMSAFWALIASIAGLRFAILVIRVQYIMGGSVSDSMLDTVNSLHIGYFVAVAVVECLNAYFLLRKFRWARGSALNVSLFSYLMRSTETRLALLAVIGVTRAVTYSFQTTAQSATTVASQLDRFAYTLECVFPIMMLIDILASRLVFANHGNSGDNYKPNGHSSKNVTRPAAEDDAIQLFTVPSNGSQVHIQGDGDPDSRNSQHLSSGVSSIAERSHTPYRSEVGGISKTVEFRIYETKDV